MAWPPVKTIEDSSSVELSFDCRLEKLFFKALVTLSRRRFNHRGESIKPERIDVQLLMPLPCCNSDFWNLDRQLVRCSACNKEFPRDPLLSKIPHVAGGNALNMSYEAEALRILADWLISAGTSPLQASFMASSAIDDLLNFLQIHLPKQEDFADYFKRNPNFHE